MKESTKLILSMPETMTCSEVAEKLGMTYNQVISARRSHGVKFAKKNQGKVTDYKLMFDMIERGETYPAIAALFGLKPQSIRHHAAKIGHSRVHVNKDKGIIHDYKRGLSIKMIQCRHNCSHDAVYRALKRNGVTPHNMVAKNDIAA